MSVETIVVFNGSLYGRMKPPSPDTRIRITWISEIGTISYSAYEIETLKGRNMKEVDPSPILEFILFMYG